ncbi:MAG: helix-turn-helix domain-containing protein [Acidobacteriota bacterium]
MRQDALKSRQSLLDAAAVVLSREPAASLEAIAAEAGVGRATLHRHFRNRQHLLKVLALDAMTALDRAFLRLLPAGAAAGTALRVLFEASLPLGPRHHFLSQQWSVMEDEEVATTYRRQLDDLAGMVEAARRAGLIAPEVPTRWVVSVLDALIYAGWAAVHSGELTVAQAADLAFRTLMTGVGCSSMQGAAP